MARTGFLFSTAKNIICELGSSRKVGELVSQSIGATSASKCVMVVTDKGIKQAKLDVACISGLRQQGYDVEVYSDVVADPPEKYILDAVKIAKSKDICAVVGLGGGSSMDVAKLVAYLAHSSCTQSLEELYGVGNGKGHRLPLLQIPTTAGTGSEVTPISIVTTGESSKKGVVMPQLLPDWAVLDGELTLSVPPHVTAATGIDAMVHAIEAYTCRTKKNPLSDLYACEALRLLGANIRTVCVDGANTAARSDMLLGSMYAGMAFANSPVGAVHALAYPIGSLFHVPHGLSNALMLPHILRFNSEISSAKEQYETLGKILIADSNRSDNNGSLGDYLEQLSIELKLPQKLREVGIKESDIPSLAEEAMKQTRLLPNNPREVVYEDAVKLYTQAW